MGLDMYLNTIKKVDGYSFEDMLAFSQQVDGAGDPWAEKVVKPLPEAVLANVETINYYGYQMQTLAPEIQYWRKAYTIHNWFVKNVQGGVDECDTYRVTKEQLEDLLQTLKQALEEGKKITVGAMDEEAVSTFFGYVPHGNRTYDELYDTYGKIDAVLHNVKFDKHYVMYRASW